MADAKKKIGILTSGGDAPGMNAAIRAVTRAGHAKGFHVVGIRKGYNGLIHGDILDLKAKDVSDIMNKGGTILNTARSEDMRTAQGLERAAQIYKILGLDALVVIGGDGSFKGAEKLSNLGVNAICIPATIDLDLTCTDYTIGFDTAINTGMEAINKLRDTSSSHERCSIVEVMGRDAGYIALWCAMSGGAEEVLVPEMREETMDEQVIQQILYNRGKGKRHNLVIVAEGVGGSQKLAEHIEAVTGIETRATILGHLQRGGTPTALDRVHSSMFGNLAVDLIEVDAKNRIIIYKDGQYSHVDITEGLNASRPFDRNMYEIIKTLSI